MKIFLLNHALEKSMVKVALILLRKKVPSFFLTEGITPGILMFLEIILIRI
jgi:hypothetical protein